MLLFLCFDTNLKYRQLLWPIILVTLFIAWAWPRKTLTKLWGRGLFLILILFTLTDFLHTDWTYITTQLSSPYEQLNRYLPNSPKVPIIFYKQAPWYNNWVLPEADFYLSLIAGHTLLASDDRTISGYIDNSDFRYFVSSAANLGHLNQIVESNFTFKKIAGESATLLIYKEDK
jgi:hypothetical protein